MRRSISKKKGRPEGERVSVAAAAPEPTRPLSPARLWLFRLLTLSLPFLLFAGLELALRLLGFGYPTTLMLPDVVAGRAVYRDNPQVTWRFFPRRLARTPQHFVIAPEKPAGVRRIVVLGESAAMGDPDPNFGFSRILDVLLRDQFPDLRFETLNAAVTAINSHTVLPIARDSLRVQPDFFIIYMGNNEVVGPFGVGTVFSPHGQSLGVIRAQIFAKSFRLGQVIDDLQQWRHRDDHRGGWQGMSLFLDQNVRFGSPGLSAVYDHFRRNLEDIIDVGQGAGATVLLGTTAVNLKDTPPFNSLHRESLGENDKKRFEHLVARGAEEDKAGDREAALRVFAEAEAIDADYAELAFRQARDLYALGRYDEARSRYERARDLDTLRFRPDSRIHQIVREVASARAAHGVRFVDIDAMMRAHSPHGIPGEELLYEHVHTNFTGNYRIAAAFLDEMARALHRPLTRPVLSEPECAERLGLSDWHRARTLNQLVARFQEAPYTNQLDHEARDARFAAQAAAQNAKLRAPGRMAEMRSAYDALLKAQPEDWVLHENLVGLLEAQADLAGQVRECEFVLDRVPHHVEMRTRLAQALLNQGRGGEAIEHFRIALRQQPYTPELYNNLGVALVSQRHVEEGIEYYRKALALDPYHQQALTNLAGALVGFGNPTEAATLFERALEAKPDAQDALLGLGQLRAKEGRTTEALTCLRKAAAGQVIDSAGLERLVRTLLAEGHADETAAALQELLASRPDSAALHEALAFTFEALSQPAAAIEEHEAALRQDPGLATAHYSLAELLVRQDRRAEALKHYEQCVDTWPDPASLHEKMAQISVALGDRAGGIRHCREVHRLRPDDWKMTNQLAWLLATAPDPTLRNGAEAVRLAKEADDATLHVDLIVLNTLAAAYAEAGAPKDAEATAQKAAQLARTQRNRAAEQEFRRLSALYAKGGVFVRAAH